jgi:hypothetical protein
MTTEYRRGDRHVYRRVAGEHLLIAIHRDTVAPMFSFSPTAAALWGWLESWSTADGLVARLLERFDVTREQAQADVAEFVEQLRSIGALDARESST